MNIPFRQLDPETRQRLLEQADAVVAAGREAQLMHKRMGQPIVICENGKVVWIPADQITVDD